MSSNGKQSRLGSSPTKQRTPLKLPGQKTIGIYFAQSKETMAMSSTITESSDSDKEESADLKSAENGSDKKRKKHYSDALTRKVKKIRKTFDSNVTFADEDDDGFLEIEIDTEKSLAEASSKKSLENSLSSNIELTIKDKSDLATDSSTKNDVDSQATDVLEGLDDLFEEEWSYKKGVAGEGEFNDLFEDDWTYGKENGIDLSSPKRCIIIDIIWEKSDMTLTVKDPKSEALTIVKCSGIWRYTKLEPGEPLVVQAKKVSLETDYWTVNNDFGYIINQPDTLISGTTVVGALFCNRRSLFQEKFRNFESLPYNEGGNHYMLTGSLSHELLQTVLDKDIREIKQINEVFEDILKSKHAIQMMYAAQVSMTDCKNLMRPAVAQIYKFIQRYIIGTSPGVPDQNYSGKIEKICDIEENVWLPSLGLKGKIDLTVEVSNKTKNNQSSSVERRILPLEIKTGRSTFSSEHQGQLILYTMMMNMTDRKTNSGLLLYLRENIMKEIIGTNHAQRDLITLRNTVAYFSSRQPTVVKFGDEEKILPIEFPKPINHPSCAKCPYNILCCSYLTEEDKKELYDSHNLKSISEKIACHLTLEHIEYVMKWTSLLQIEESYDNQDVTSWKDVWTLEPSKREKRGSCISNLTLVSVTENCGRFLHEFQRFKDGEEISESNFLKQEYIIISTDNRINICSGFIDRITSTTVLIHCDKDITKVYKDNVFHIDKSSSSTLLTRNMSQVAGLLDDHEICSKLRKIIIERRPARFTNELPDRVMEVSNEIFESLNEDQKRAILKTLSADEYILIKGYPGTGKTQTLVAMIELLIKLDKSVIVTAHTNTAIDNILLKLLDRNIDFIRLGSTLKTHPSVLQKSDENVTAHCDSPESLHTVYCSKKVVGVTCFGAVHPHLSRRKFDYCIVDESTQVLQPTILQPLYCASKFVLVGDPEQLPPIAKSTTARKFGLNESLFSRLDSENNSVSLKLQYRMNSCIMNIANKLTYNDQLKVGNKTIGNATMPVTNVADLESCEEWVRKTLSLRLKNSVIMLNTSATYHLTIDSTLGETKQRGTNRWEAAIILRLIKVLRNLGIASEDIGIISPYRAQVHFLQTICCSDIEINTVDQYQGRDKSVIIYACVKSISSDSDIQEFDILEDKQRLTVAVTRAKHKLIIIGDLNTLQRYSPLKKLIETLRSHDQIYNLEDGKDDFCFNDLIKFL